MEDTMIIQLKDMGFRTNGERRRFEKYGLRLMIQYEWKSQGTAWRMLRRMKSKIKRYDPIKVR